MKSQKAFLKLLFGVLIFVYINCNNDSDGNTTDCGCNSDEICINNVCTPVDGGISDDGGIQPIDGGISDDEGISDNGGTSDLGGVPESVTLHQPKALFISQLKTQSKPNFTILRHLNTGVDDGGDAGIGDAGGSGSNLYEVTQNDEILPVTVTNSLGTPFTVLNLKKLNDTYVGFILEAQGVNLTNDPCQLYSVLLNVDSGGMLDFSSMYSTGYCVLETSLDSWILRGDYLYLISGTYMVSPSQTLYRVSIQDKQATPINNAQYDLIISYLVFDGAYVLANTYSGPLLYPPNGSAPVRNPDMDLSSLSDEVCQDLWSTGPPCTCSTVDKSHFLSLLVTNGFYYNGGIYSSSDEENPTTIQYLLNGNGSGVIANLFKREDTSTLGLRYIPAGEIGTYGHLNYPTNENHHKYIFFQNGCVYLNDDLTWTTILRNFNGTLPISVVHGPDENVYSYSHYLAWMDHQNQIQFWDFINEDTPQMISSTYSVRDFTIVENGIFFTSYITATEIATYFIDFNNSFEISLFNASEVEIISIAEF